MIVLVLTAAPPGLRGDLSRWLLEVAPGVFVGRISRRVRDMLWIRVRYGVMRGGSAIMVIPDPAREQGYQVMATGRDRWVPVDFDGLMLMRRPHQPPGRRRGRRRAHARLREEADG